MTLFTDVLRRLSLRDLNKATFGPSPDAKRMASLGQMMGLALLAAFAIALRLRMMLIGRSLWLDETALALNICSRSFAELLTPLDHDQAAPIGFLFIERAAVLAFGPNEFALRLFPFLSSILSLGLIFRFCAINMGRWAAVVAVTLAGILPAMFYYSGELKQYSSDVCIGLLILVMTSEILRSGLSASRAIGLTIAGVVAVWISHPSVFVLAGAGTTLLLKAAIERRYRLVILTSAISASWLASFALEYFLFLKDLQANNFLADYWESAFLKFPPTSPKDLRVYPAVGFGIFEALFHNAQVDVDLSMRMGVFLGAAWLIGIVTLYRQGKRQMLALLILPLAFAVLACMMHKYPLKSRLALFTAATTVPVIAAGMAGLMASRDITNRAIGVVLLGCALLLPTMQAAQFLIERPRLHDARSVLSEVAVHWKPGDIVVADRYSELPFQYYQRYGDVVGLDRVSLTKSDLSLNEPGDLAREIKKWKGYRRVWFLFDTALPDPINLSRGALIVLLDQEGVPIESASCRRYSAHLYSFNRFQYSQHIEESQSNLMMKNEE